MLAIANQKGGVAKTTTVASLGAALADLDVSVLVVDLDPQGCLTFSLGHDPDQLESSVHDVLLGEEEIADVLLDTDDNVTLLPATIDLAGAEALLLMRPGREYALKRALAEVAEDYDVILIDCPPALGLLTVNALVAAQEVLVPIQCEYYALEGLGQLVGNVDLVRANLNPDLKISTIALVMYDARTNLSEQVAEEVRTFFGDKVCRQVIPRSVRLSEAPSFGQPITVFDPTCRGAVAYRQLAKEVLR